MSLLASSNFAPQFPRSFKHHVASKFALCILISSIVMVGIWVSPAFASPRTSKTDPIAQAKLSVAQAEKEASTAATQYSNAYSELNKIDDNLSDTKTQLTVAQTTISTLHAKASTQAQDAYIHSSDETGDESYSQVVDDSRREQFRATVSQFDDAELTTLVGLKQDLQVKQDDLAKLQKDRKSTLDSLSAQKKSLDAKLANATKAQNALQAQAARNAKIQKISAKKSSTAVGTIINSGTGPIACPIAGALAFTNDWGQPRSGGRTHKGNDLFNPRGTPNVAVTDGTVFFQNETVGGLSAYVTGGGYTYYYTHLEDTVGSARHVKRGEVIGHTGNTGNAEGGATHTHFEIRVGGPNGTKINPYSTLRSVC